MSLLAAASSSVRCDLCCQLLPSAVALAAHAVSCFEEITQAFNDGFSTAKRGWAEYKQAALAASKPPKPSPVVPPSLLPPSPLTRKDDAVHERKLLVHHARTLLKLLDAADAPPSSAATGSDPLTKQLLQQKTIHADALRQSSQQLLNQLTNGAAGRMDDVATKLLLSAGVRLCSFVTSQAVLARDQPSRLLLHPPSLAALSVEEFAHRFVDAFVRHSHESGYMRLGCSNGT
jgi:hypothetical protein